MVTLEWENPVFYLLKYGISGTVKNIINNALHVNANKINKTGLCTGQLARQHLAHHVKNLNVKSFNILLTPRQGVVQ